LPLAINEPFAKAFSSQNHNHTLEMHKAEMYVMVILLRAAVARAQAQKDQPTTSFTCGRVDEKVARLGFYRIVFRRQSICRLRKFIT